MSVWHVPPDLDLMCMVYDFLKFSLKKMTVAPYLVHISMIEDTCPYLSISYLNYYFSVMVL